MSLSLGVCELHKSCLLKSFPFPSADNATGAQTASTQTEDTLTARDALSRHSRILNTVYEVPGSNLNSEDLLSRIIVTSSVQSLLPSRLQSRNVKVKIYKTIILPVVLYECETWSLTLREEHRLRVFENRV
jgi:hypothetical protein